MGITGLIPFLDQASSRVNIKDFGGTTVAVDSYCWLHKGVYSCAEKLVRGEDCDQYIKYCLKYVNMLLSYNIKPIMVFDGQHLPAKALTEQRRRESRQESKKRAKELLRLGKVEQARSFMRRCVDITHEMALRLIKECRLRNVDCIVAPYEADAQMAWLNKVGIAQFVITEDSDLTLFGARNIIFKLDLTGSGLLVESEKLHLAMGCNKEQYDFEKFRRMCILSGCDYLDSLPGIGLAKSCKFILKTEDDDMNIALKKIPQYLNMKQLQVDDEYIENFHKAEATFKHMYIFNPFERKMERLNALEDYQTDEKYCSNAGSPLNDHEKVLHLALGNLNPNSFQQLDDWVPENGLPKLPSKEIKRAKHKSVWLTAFEKLRSNESFSEQKKPMTCAIYFKKVDFISKNIEQDIIENMKAENSKPAEADVMELYKQEVSASKRKRRNSKVDSTTTSPINESITPKKSCHNPFIKVIGNFIDKEEISSSVTVCTNASLLKVLSPTENKQETTRRLRSHTRNLNNVENEQIEVRSRFFAENVKLVQKLESFSELNQTMDIAETTDVSEEIEQIEKLSQQHKEIQAMLYHSPSPQKSVKNKYEDKILTQSDSGIESLATSENNDITSEVIDKTITTKPIELSDEDSTDNQNIAATNNYKIIKFEGGKQTKTSRLSLTKSKPKIQKSKTTRNTVSPKNSSSQLQTRLSMFGFKKRPSLV